MPVAALPIPARVPLRVIPTGTGPIASRLRGRPPESARVEYSVARALGRILGHAEPLACDWAALTYDDAKAVRDHLARRAMLGEIAPSYARFCVRIFRRILTECHRLGTLSTERLELLTDLPAIRGESLPAGRAVTREEVERLVAYCALVSPRDAAYFAVSFGAALRVMEAAHLRCDSYRAGVLTIRRGKGMKDAVVPVLPWCREPMEKWLSLRSSGWLICTTDALGEIVDAPMSEAGLRQLCYTRAAEAGTERFSPHDLRRGAITYLDHQGIGLSLIQKWARHSNLATTSRYLRRTENEVAEAVEALK